MIRSMIRSLRLLAVLAVPVLMASAANAQVNVQGGAATSATVAPTMPPGAVASGGVAANAGSGSASNAVPSGLQGGTAAGGSLEASGATGGNGQHR